MTVDPPDLGVPTVLRGQSAARLIAVGQLVIPIAGLCVIPIVFESEFKSAENLWAGLWLTLVYVLLAVGLGVLLRGYRKRRAEVEAGYTTLRTMFAKNHDLYLLDAVTHDVLLRPALPWRSEATGRLVAGMRGERTHAPDESMFGEARARDEVRQIEAEQGRSSIGYPPVRRGLLIAAMLAPLAVLAVGVGILLHPRNAPPNQSPTHPRGPTVSLHHSNVEQRIDVFNQESGVLCNDGHDITVTHVGQTFTCTARNGTPYTVTITDQHTGAYSVG